MSTIHIETFCPQCNARLHIANFWVTDLPDEEDLILLHINCWQCTWETAFKIEHFAAEED